MKLKRLFLDKKNIFAAGLLLLAAGLLNISCSSNKMAFPIPGQNQTAITNIYIEYLNLADTYFELEKYDKAES